MANEKRLIDADALMDALGYDPMKFWEITPESTFGIVLNAPTVDAVEVEKYNALVEMYHELRDNFIDYVCSGTCNVAPYCLNRCEGCVDRAGWCNQGSDECHGFNPAEVILDEERKDNEN